MLPEVRSSSEVYGETDPALLGGSVPIAGIAGDQQAALFGQACFEPGTAKNTYGTGCFMLLNTGETPVPSQKGLVTTIALADRRQDRPMRSKARCSSPARPCSGCATGCARSRRRRTSRALMTEVPDTDGVYLVPAFVGLGAPYWDPRARGIDRRPDARTRRWRTSRGRRWTRWRTRRATCSR